MASLQCNGVMCKVVETSDMVAIPQSVIRRRDSFGRPFFDLKELKGSNVFYVCYFP